MNLFRYLTNCLIILAVLIVLFSCSHKQSISLSSKGKVCKPEDYNKFVTSWTKSGSIYDEMFNILKFKATYHSRELLQCQAQAYSKMMDFSIEDTKIKLNEIFELSELNHVFLVAATTADIQYNNFSESDTIWEIRLINKNMKKFTPLDIEQIVNVTPELKFLYPQITKFSRVYRISFPKTDSKTGNNILNNDDPLFSVKVVSALGKVNLTWYLTSISHEKTN